MSTQPETQLHYVRCSFHCDWSAHVHHMLHYQDVVANCVPSFFGVVVSGNTHKHHISQNVHKQQI